LARRVHTDPFSSVRLFGPDKCVYATSIKKHQWLLMMEIGCICAFMTNFINVKLLQCLSIMPFVQQLMKVFQVSQTAKRRFMNRPDFLKPRLIASLLIPACSLFAGTACGAQQIVGADGTPLGQQAAPHSPELDRADERVDTAKSKVDQAHKQLAAAKAMVKAAEAELKASRADRDALALRNDAQQLADAAGIQSTAVLPDNSIRQVIIPPQGNRLAPVPAAVNPIPVQPAARAQAQSLVEFNAQPASDVAAPAKDLSPAPGAPAPSAELKPQMQPEPNSVP
jgi:hypothetical protein